MRRMLKWTSLTLAALVVAAATYLLLVPPELLRIGSGYAAKIVCSNVFIAGRDAETVLTVDVQAPGHPLLRLMQVEVDEQAQRVTARLFGFGAPGYAAFRPGLGCTSVPDGDFDSLSASSLPPVSKPEDRSDLPWPEGSASVPVPAIAEILADPALAGSGLRAALVVHDGRIVAERYGEGFDMAAPLLGWSMTKTVTAALIGLRIAEDAMALDASGLRPEWASDGRAAIRLADLLAMQSGLAFNEDYGDVADVTRMLYLERDMAGFAASLPLEHAPGTEFSYSSGTTTLLSRLWMDTLPSRQEALAFPREALFGPLGMTSAVMETDASDTFVGSSYLYATARDWARFGQFILQDGVWEGLRLLPEGFVALMGAPTAVSGGRYGSGQMWISAGRDGVASGLPDDTRSMRGHDGQTVVIIPSRKLVIVRLGLTPTRTFYQPTNLVNAVVKAIDAL